MSGRILRQFSKKEGNPSVAGVGIALGDSYQGLAVHWCT